MQLAAAADQPAQEFRDKGRLSKSPDAANHIEHAYILRFGVRAVYGPAVPVGRYLRTSALIIRK